MIFGEGIVLKIANLIQLIDPAARKKLTNFNFVEKYVRRRRKKRLSRACARRLLHEKMGMLMQTRKYANTVKYILMLAGIGFASAATASLETRPDGMVYDTDLNITWLADANLPTTNTFGVSGIDTTYGNMNWNTAQSWVAAMDAANYLGYSDWRLPTADPACGFNYNCPNSELGHLFYQELGVTAGNSILTGNTVALAKFNNIQDLQYWTGTAYEPDPYYVWTFSADGQQRGIDNIDFINAWAVRSGDVTAVPLPSALWLFGSALAGLIGIGRRKRF